MFYKVVWANPYDYKAIWNKKCTEKFLLKYKKNISIFTLVLETYNYESEEAVNFEKCSALRKI